MKPNKIMLLFALILIIPLFHAQGMVKALAVEIQAEQGEISITHVQTVIDYLSEQEEDAPYLVKLKDTQGKTIYQLKSFFYFLETPGQGLEFNEEYDIEEFIENQKENFYLTVYLPYKEEQVYITLESAEGELDRFELSQLCNSDSICQETENFLSCPGDCRLAEHDNYCFPKEDNKCDPDCLEGIDPDCGKQPTTPKRPEQDSNLLLLVVGGAIIIVIILIFFKMRKQ